MNPNPNPGGEFGLPPQGQQWSHGPQPPPGPQEPRPQGRYGTGLVAVLCVIAVLGGASFLGGGLAVGGMLTARIAEDPGSEPAAQEPSEEPAESPTPEEPPNPPEVPSPDLTEEPTDPPAEDPDEPLLTAEEVVTELRDEYDDLQAGADMTGEVCEEDEDDPLFVCTGAVHTNLVRVVTFENSFLAETLAMGIRNQADEGEGDAVDAQDACHVVLVWFEEGGMDQADRDTMAGEVDGIVDC